MIKNYLKASYYLRKAFSNHEWRYNFLYTYFHEKAIFFFSLILKKIHQNYAKIYIIILQSINICFSC